jgi:adenosylmethionine-8-amino-7-oxononanoate aminotransferase
LCARVLENAILQEGAENVSAFIAEPVVGAALGAVPAPDGYFQIIREICDKYDVLFLADEVMCGLGRTGKNFAIDHWGVVPDMIATAKGMGGGYCPVGACIISSEIVAAIRKENATFVGGFTHAGHLFAARVATAVLDYTVRNNLIQNSAEMGAYLLEGLKSLLDFRIVGDVRGQGLMCGVELVKDKRTKEPFAGEDKVAELVVEAAMQRGLIVYPGHGNVNGDSGDHLLIGPPLTIRRPQVEEMVNLLRESLESVEKTLMA